MNHTDAQKAEARRLYESQGATKAADATGIPKRTIYAWAKAGDWLSTCSPQNTGPMIEAARRRMAECRHETQVNLAEAARSGSSLLVELLEERDTHKAKDAAVTTAVALDKLRLELGEVTDRTEHRTVDQLDAELDDLASRLGADA